MAGIKNCGVNMIQYTKCFREWTHRRPSQVFNFKNNFLNCQNFKCTSVYLDTRCIHSKDSHVNTLQFTSKSSKLQYYATNRGCSTGMPSGNTNAIRECNINGKAPVYTKLQDKDPKLSNIMLQIKSRKKKRELVLLEGKRLIQDCIDAGIVPEIIAFSRVEDLNDLVLPGNGVQLYKVSYKSLSLWSDLSSCPGVIGIIKIPTVNEKNSRGLLPVTIICDSIRDPGNLGSILRAAAGVGCQKVLLMKGCVDAWGTKVLRSGSGAHFRMAIYENVVWDMVDAYLEEDCTVFLADNHKSEITDLQRPVRRSNSEIQSKDRLVKTDLQSSCNGCPTVPYYSIDYTNHTSLVLVVGSESEGLSNGAFKLLNLKRGTCITIPLNNGVESLNTGTALGILVFEMKRQLRGST